MLLKMAVHEYFITIDCNFQIKLPVKHFFPIHSGIAHHYNKAFAMGMHGTHLLTRTNLKGFLFAVLQMCWLCRAKPAKTSFQAASKHTGTEDRAAGTSHYSKPEMHRGIEECSKRIEDNSVVAITFCLS